MEYMKPLLQEFIWNSQPINITVPFPEPSLRPSNNMLGLSTTFALEKKTRFEWQGISMHRFYPGLEEGPINIAGQRQDGRTCLHVPPRVATRVHVLCLSAIQYFVFLFSISSRCLLCPSSYQSAWSTCIFISYRRREIE